TAGFAAARAVGPRADLRIVVDGFFPGGVLRRVPGNRIWQCGQCSGPISKPFRHKGQLIMVTHSGYQLREVDPEIRGSSVECGAGGGDRTRTPLSGPRILSRFGDAFRITRNRSRTR